MSVPNGRPPTSPTDPPPPGNMPPQHGQPAQQDHHNAPPPQPNAGPYRMAPNPYFVPGAQQANGPPGTQQFRSIPSYPFTNTGHNVLSDTSGIQINGNLSYSNNPSFAQTQATEAPTAGTQASETVRHAHYANHNNFYFPGSQQTFTQVHNTDAAGPQQYPVSQAPLTAGPPGNNAHRTSGGDLDFNDGLQYNGDQDEWAEVLWGNGVRDEAPTATQKEAERYLTQLLLGSKEAQERLTELAHSRDQVQSSSGITPHPQQLQTDDGNQLKMSMFRPEEPLEHPANSLDQMQPSGPGPYPQQFQRNDGNPSNTFVPPNTFDYVQPSAGIDPYPQQLQVGDNKQSFIPDSPNDAVLPGIVGTSTGSGRENQESLPLGATATISQKRDAQSAGLQLIAPKRQCTSDNKNQQPSTTAEPPKQEKKAKKKEGGVRKRLTTAEQNIKKEADYKDIKVAKDTIQDYTAEQALAIITQTAPLAFDPKEDDVEAVKRDKKKWIGAILAAFDADYSKEPHEDNDFGGNLPLFSVWQKQNYNKTMFLIKVDQLHKGGHLPEACATLIFNHVIDCHEKRRLLVEGTVGVYDATLKCSKRLEEIVEVTKRLAIIRHDIVSNERLWSLVASPWGLFHRKEENKVSNEKKPKAPKAQAIHKQNINNPATAGGAPQGGETTAPQDGKTAAPQNHKTATPQDGEAAAFAGEEDALLPGDGEESLPDPAERGNGLPSGDDDGILPYSSENDNGSPSTGWDASSFVFEG